MQPVVQSAFTSGELSPALQGRQDLAKYDSAARFIQNFIIRPAGGASKRPGTRFVGYSNAGAGFATPPRLIPFVFNQQQTYVLEFGFDSGGAGKIRFITDAGFVVDGASAVYSITHPYTVAELPEVNYTQANDIITLVHRNHPVRQLKRYGHASWILELMEFKSRVKAPIRPGVMRNTKKTTTHATDGSHRYKAAVIDSGNVNYGPFTDEVLCNGEHPLSATEFNRISFGFPKDLTGYTLGALQSVRIGIWKDGVFYAANNYGITESQQWIDNGSGAAGTAPSGAQTLTYTIPWINTQTVTAVDTAIATVTDSQLAYKVVAVSESGDESEPSAEIGAIQDLAAGQYVTLFWTPPQNANTTIRNTSTTGQATNVGVTLGTFMQASTFVPYKRSITDPVADIVPVFAHTHAWTDQDGNTLGTASTLLLASGHIGKTITYTVTATATIDGVSTVVDKASVSWANPVAASGNPNEKPTVTAPSYTYKIYRSKDGGQFQLIGSTKALCFNDKNQAASTGIAEPLNLFAKAGDYPGAVTYFQQRLVFAGSNNSPMSIWFSKTGDSSSFTKHSPLIDDDAMSITIAANETSQIQHLVPLGDLLVLTSGGEWRVSGSQSQDALTPSNIAATPQGTRGSSALRPVAIGTRTIFLQRLSKTVRAIAYSWEADGYQSEDLTLMADHLTEENTITDWAFAQSPHGHLYCLRDDGVILVCTLLPEQQVIAWSRIKLDYPVQSLCVIPENGRDTLYLAAQTRRRTKTAGVYSAPILESAILRLEELPVDQAGANALDLFLEATAPVLTTVASTVVGNYAAGAGVGFELVSFPPLIKVATTANMTGIINIGDKIMIEGMDGFEQKYGGTDPDWMHPSQSFLNGKHFIVSRVDADGILFPSGITDSWPSFDATEALDNTFNYWRSGGTIKKALTSVSGLDHLRDRWTKLIVDGKDITTTVRVNPDTAVSPPGFTLTTSAGFHVIVGLPFIAELKTLPPGGQMLPGGRKRINRVRLRVQETAGLEVAPDLGDDDATALWHPVRPDDGSTSLAPIDQVCKSFIFTQPVDPNWTTQGGLRLRSTSPLPCTILNVIPEVENGN